MLLGTLARNPDGSRLMNPHGAETLAASYEMSDLGDGDRESLSDSDAAEHRPSSSSRSLALAFFLFGVLNNSPYVVILSAAVDLVPASTPKGIIAMANIAPALVVKLSLPYVTRGDIRYARRVYICAGLTFAGMLIMASTTSVAVRLIGIMFASASSGLGELSFLQLSSTYSSSALSKTAIGAWSSGTGGAGIVGAGLWWFLRKLGVRPGLLVSSVLPLGFPLVWAYLLPTAGDLSRGFDSEDIVGYEPVFAIDDDASEVSVPVGTSRKVADDSQEQQLSFAEKLDLVKPIVRKYMIWLFLVYLFEYTINSGVAPTLVFEPPTSGLWSKIFKKPSDFYPFWAVTYQTFVFLSRSSISIGIPPIPRALLPVPALLQGVVLALLSSQAAAFVFSGSHKPTTPQHLNSWWQSFLNLFSTTSPGLADRSGDIGGIWAVFLFTCLEGLCGGSSYANTFLHLGREEVEGTDGIKQARIKEFKMGSAGAADSLGILFASIVAVPVERALCQAQVDQGRTLCRDGS